MGTHPIKYVLLNKHELTYEVLIRGDEPAPTVLGLRKQITKLATLIPNDDIYESGIDVAVDCEAVLISITELSARVNSLNSKYDYNLYERSKALHNHIHHRLRRIHCSDSAFVKKLNSLVSEFGALSKKLTALQKPDPVQSGSSEQSSCAQSSSALEVPAVISVQCDHTQTGELSKLKYDGSGCVRAFVQKMNEYRTVRNLPSDKLLAYASEIFTGNALHWFRSVRGTVNNWDELIVQLIEDFSPFDYDYRLMSEIRNRTQGETENIIIYLSIMSEMFSRLSKQISEQEKLEIFLHNIRPCYATVLASCATGINSIAMLRKLCINYEKIQCCSSQFHEPPRVSSGTLAPDLAYSRPEPKAFYNKNNYYFNKPYSYNQSNTTRNYKSNNSNNVPVSAVEEGKNKNAIFCPRCRTNEHSLRQCQQNRYPICFKCGLKDCIYPNCPKCQPRTNQKN